LVDALEDSPDLQAGWSNFFMAIQGDRQENLASVASAGFKKPLMQAAYSKNPMSFLNEAQDFLEDPDFAEAYKTHLDHHYNGNTSAAAEDLRDAIGAALYQIIDSKSNRVMMNFSQWLAVLNHPIHIPGATGDSIVIAPVGVSTINLGGHSRNTSNLPVTGVSGRKFKVKVPNLKTDTLYTPEGEAAEYPVQERQYQPAARRVKSYYNKATREIMRVVEPYGYALRRMAPVLLIQALDGDAMAMMTNWVNSAKNRVGGLPPRPTITVYDSTISSPGSALIYENAYNNVVIPHMMDHIKGMGKALKKNADDAQKAVQEYLKAQKDTGTLIGIGADGEYPALGGILDEYHDKVYGESYEQAVKDPKWLAEQRAVWKSLLKEAEANGWVPMEILKHEPNIVPGTLAVTPEQAAKLFGIAKQFLGLDPSKPNGNVQEWLANFEDRVTRAKKEIFRVNSRGGITQLSPAAFKGATGAPQSKPPEMNRAQWEAERKARQTLSDKANAFIKEKGLDDLPKSEGLTSRPDKEAELSMAEKKRVDKEVRKTIYQGAKTALSSFYKYPGDNSQIDNLLKQTINDTPVDDLKLSKIVKEVKDKLTKIQKDNPSFMNDDELEF